MFRPSLWITQRLMRWCESDFNPQSGRLERRNAQPLKLMSSPMRTRLLWPAWSPATRMMRRSPKAKKENQTEIKKAKALEKLLAPLLPAAKKALKLQHTPVTL